MKRKLFAVCVMLAIFICILACSYAMADGVHHTVTFHGGNDGVFANGTSENVLSYGEPTGGLTTKYSHTPNVDDYGNKSSNYGNSLNLNEVVTIPGATSLHVVITYGGESASYDWVCLWSGSHANYMASSDYMSSITGRLGGGNHTSASNTKTYDVAGDTVTFGFRSDSSGYGDGYGYYAVITYDSTNSELLSGEYQDVSVADLNTAFSHWVVGSANSETVFDVSTLSKILEDTDVYAIYLPAHHAITFHTGSGGAFADSSTTNLVKYSMPQEPVVRYAHTPNIADDGTQNGVYANSYNNTTVVTLPGATHLEITVTYGGDTSYDNLYLWEGANPTYSVSNNSSQALARLYLREYSGAIRTVTYHVEQESVTFGFSSDSYATDGSGYGYYAVVTGYFPDPEIIEGTYKEPFPVGSQVFAGWSVSEDGSTGILYKNELPNLEENTDLYAVYANAWHTITFHSGDDGVFSNDETENVVTYSGVVYDVDRRIAHTSNVFDNGQKKESYKSNVNERQIVTIPGAQSLYITAHYAIDSTHYVSSNPDQDGFCMWDGSHSDYTVRNNASSSFTGLLDGGFSSGNSTLKNYVVAGNSVTLGFHSNDTSSSNVNDNKYGYYAIIENGGYAVTGAYEEPSPIESYMRFKEWNTEPDGSGTSYLNVATISEDVDLYAIYEESIIYGGVYRDVNWKLRKGDSMLILGLPDETQTYSYAETQVQYSSTSGWPWTGVKALRLDGPVVGNGAMSYMFYNSGLTEVDLSDFDLSLVTDSKYMFGNCDQLMSIDLSNKDISSLENMSYMFYDCAKLESVSFADSQLSSVVNMNRAFMNLPLLEAIDLSGVSVDTLQDVAYAFYNCPVLSYLDISGFDFSNVTSSSLMFAKCASLERFKFGNSNPVACANGKHINLPMNWAYALEDSNPLVGPYFASELLNVYSADDAGYWVRMDLSNTPYAVYDGESETLYFLRSETPLVTDSEEIQTVHSLDGTEVSGVVYAVDESASRVNNAWSASVNSAKHIVSLDPIYLKGYNPHDWFAGLASCEDMDLLKFDVGSLTSCAQMFAGCSSLTELDLSTWDPYLATSMDSMFGGCISLTKLDLQNFTFVSRDVYGATTMFSGCSELMELDVSGCEVSSILNFTNGMLPKLQRIHIGIYPGGGGYTSSVLPGGSALWTREDGAYGPYDADQFGSEYSHYSITDSAEKKAQEGWYVRENCIVAMYCPNAPDDYHLYFFRTSDSFTSGSWATLHRVDDDSRTYSGMAYRLPYVTDGSTSSPSWYNKVGGTKHVVVLDEFAPPSHSISYWFNGLSNLRDVDLRKLDMSEVTSMYYTFANSGTTYDTVLDLTYLDVSSVKTMYSMFYQTKVTTLDLTGWDTSNVTQADRMFSYIQGHVIAPNLVWNYIDLFYFLNNCPDGTVLDVPNWTINGSGRKDNNGDYYATELFNYCYADINAPNWTINNVVSIANMFRGINGSGHKIDASGWKSDSVTNASYLCSYSYNLLEINLSNWDMPALELTADMFVSNSNLERVIGLETWPASTTDGITATASMFESCSRLPEIDLSTWQVDALQDASRMFTRCYLLTDIDLSGFHSTNTANLDYMFSECVSLVSLKIPYLNTVSGDVSATSLFSSASALQELTVGSDFLLKSTHALHTIPRYGISSKWTDTSGAYGPYSTQLLVDDYPEGFSGTWVWEIADMRYFIQFEAPDGTVGSMPSVVVDSIYSQYMIPENKFRRPGSTFSYWRDNIRGTTYSNKGIISSNYYSPGDVVVLTAVFNKRGGEAVTMQDGEFMLKLRKDEQAIFTGLPANTVYQVYEDTPYGWTLVASNDTSGVIVPESKSSATFGNEFNGNKCSLILSGEKFINGELAGDSEFQFELLDDDGDVIDTALPSSL